MEIWVAVDPGRYAVKAAACVAVGGGADPMAAAVTTWTPSLAWVGEGGEVAVGHGAAEAGAQAPGGLVDGWLDRIFSLRPIGGDGSGPRPGDLLVELVRDVLHRTATGLGQDLGDVSQVRLALVEEHGWSAPQLAAVQRALERAGRTVFPAAEVQVLSLPVTDALLGLPQAPPDRPVLVLDVGATATTALLLDLDGADAVRRAPGLGGERLDRIRREAAGQVDDDRTEPHGSAEMLAQLLGGEVRAMVATALPVLDEAAARGAPVEKVLVVGGVAHLGLVARVAEHDLGLPVQVVPEPAHAAALGALGLLAADEWWGESPAASGALAGAAALAGGAGPGAPSRWPVPVAAAALVVVGLGLAVLAWPDPQAPDEARPPVSSTPSATAAVTASPSTDPFAVADDFAITTDAVPAESREPQEAAPAPTTDAAPAPAPVQPAAPAPEPPPAAPPAPPPPVEQEPEPPTSEPPTSAPEPDPPPPPPTDAPEPTQAPPAPSPTTPPPAPIPTQPAPTVPPLPPLPTVPLPTVPQPTVPAPPPPPSIPPPTGLP